MAYDIIDLSVQALIAELGNRKFADPRKASEWTARSCNLLGLCLPDSQPEMRVKLQDRLLDTIRKVEAECQPSPSMTT